MIISIFPLVLIVLLIVSFATRKGKVVLSEPYCAKCGYDLRVNWDSSMVCPECGTDLKAKNAVNFGKTNRKVSAWYTWVFLAVLLGVLGVLLIAPVIVRTGSASPGSSPAAIRSQSNATIINNLPTLYDEPWSWQELERRFKAGALTTQELDQAVDALIKGLKTKPQVERAPLNWCGDFIAKRMLDGSISGKQANMLLMTYYGAPGKISSQKTHNREGFSAVRVDFIHPWPLGGMPQFNPYCTLKQISVIEDPNKVVNFVTGPQFNKGLKENTQALTIPFRGETFYIKAPFKPGQYSLQFKFTNRYYLDIEAGQEPGAADRPYSTNYHTADLKATVHDDGSIELVPLDLSQAQ